MATVRLPRPEPSRTAPKNAYRSGCWRPSETSCSQRFAGLRPASAALQPGHPLPPVSGRFSRPETPRTSAALLYHPASLCLQQSESRRSAPISPVAPTPNLHRSIESLKEAVSASGNSYVCNNAPIASPRQVLRVAYIMVGMQTALLAVTFFRDVLPILQNHCQGGH